MKRVLIANRGEIARRLVRFYRDNGIETVAVFSEPDADQPYVEEADYAVYLGGSSPYDTYLNGSEIVGAAFDSGSDLIHPGYCFLADRVDFLSAAWSVNMPVVGPHPQVMSRVLDRSNLRAAAEHLGLPVIPVSDPIGEGEDGLKEAARMGVPLWAKSVHGGILRRVSRLEDVPGAVAGVRAGAKLFSGQGEVYLEREVEAVRHVGTFVVGDHHGGYAQVGTSDGSLRLGYGTWIEELGPGVVSEDLLEKLEAGAVELARAMGWVGVGRVRWALTPQGWYLMKISPRLTTGYSLVEHMFNIDLLSTQHRVLSGDELGWDGSSARSERYGLQLRLLHVDPVDGRSRPAGVLERFELPDGALVEAGTEEGQRCSAETDPILAKITVSGPTRQSALVRAVAALSEVRVEGVPTNRDLLLQVLSDEGMWRGRRDVHTLGTLVGD